MFKCKLHFIYIFKTDVTYNYSTTSSPSNRLHPTNPLRHRHWTRSMHRPPPQRQRPPHKQTVGDSIVKLPCQTVRTAEEHIKRPDCQISTPEKPPGHFGPSNKGNWSLWNWSLWNSKMTNNKNDSKVTNSLYWPSNSAALTLCCCWPHMCTPM